MYSRWNRSLVSSSSWETLPAPVESWEIFQRPLPYCRTNSSFGAVTPPEAAMYCPALFSRACSVPEATT